MEMKEKKQIAIKDMIDGLAGGVYIDFETANIVFINKSGIISTNDANAFENLEFKFRERAKEIDKELDKK